MQGKKSEIENLSSRHKHYDMLVSTDKDQFNLKEKISEQLASEKRC